MYPIVVVYDKGNYYAIFPCPLAAAIAAYAWDSKLPLSIIPPLFPAAIPDIPYCYFFFIPKLITSF